jgi:hypothetical protein
MASALVGFGVVACGGGVENDDVAGMCTAAAWAPAPVPSCTNNIGGAQSCTCGSGGMCKDGTCVSCGCQATETCSDGQCRPTSGSAYWFSQGLPSTSGCYGSPPLLA